ncbi:hypothetical protein HDV05_002729, partial [Chytridiales sp. JEL 0842]
MSKLFDFEHQFLGYAEYHNNRINQNIHMIFVPTIVWTGMVWCHNIPAFTETWFLQDTYTPFNLTFVLTFLYTAYYVILKPKLGLPVVPFMFLMNYSAYQFLHSEKVNGLNVLGGVSPNVIASGIHIAAWIFQFLGHGLAEKRKPALMDNLLHAAVLGLFFVWSEALFRLGFFQEMAKDLQEKTDKRVAAFRASLKKD